MSTEPTPPFESCTLAPAERPLRAAEFVALFASALRRVRRPAATRLRLVLDAAAEATVRDLTAREAACCSFFSFTLTPAGGELVVDVEVPAGHVEALDALAAGATAVPEAPA